MANWKSSEKNMEGLEKTWTPTCASQACEQSWTALSARAYRNEAQAGKE